MSYRIKAFNHNINLPNQVKSPIQLTSPTYSSLKVCPGNPDLEFLQLAEKKETKTFSDAHGKLESNLNFHFKINFNLNNRSNHCSCRRIPVQNNQTHQLPHAAIKSFKMQRLHLIQEKSTFIDIENDVQLQQRDVFGSKTNHRYMLKSLMLNKISELQNKLVKQEL